MCCRGRIGPVIPAIVVPLLNNDPVYVKFTIELNALGTGARSGWLAASNVGDGSDVRMLLDSILTCPTSYAKLARVQTNTSPTGGPVSSLGPVWFQVQNAYTGGSYLAGVAAAPDGTLLYTNPPGPSALVPPAGFVLYPPGMSSPTAALRTGTRYGVQSGDGRALRAIPVLGSTNQEFTLQWALPASTDGFPVSTMTLYSTLLTSPCPRIGI